jgi:hypothetical protein
MLMSIQPVPETGDAPLSIEMPDVHFVLLDERTTGAAHDGFKIDEHNDLVYRLEERLGLKFAEV